MPIEILYAERILCVNDTDFSLADLLIAFM